MHEYEWFRSKAGATPRRLNYYFRDAAYLVVGAALNIPVPPENLERSRNPAVTEASMLGVLDKHIPHVASPGHHRSKRCFVLPDASKLGSGELGSSSSAYDFEAFCAETFQISASDRVLRGWLSRRWAEWQKKPESTRECVPDGFFGRDISYYHMKAA